MSQEREDQEDWEWREHERAQRRAYACQCGGDMPGTCPGPAYCPMVKQQPDDGDDVDDAEMYREDDPEPDSNRTLGLVTI